VKSQRTLLHDTRADVLCDFTDLTDFTDFTDLTDLTDLTEASPGGRVR
jgi:hypothetical protein